MSQGFYDAAGRWLFEVVLLLAVVLGLFVVVFFQERSK